LWIDRRPAGW